MTKKEALKQFAYMGAVWFGNLSINGSTARRLTWIGRDSISTISTSSVMKTSLLK